MKVDLVALIVITLSQLDSYVSLGELDRLYAELAERLESIVRHRVRAADALVEDACQFAWSQLVRHVGRVRSDCVLPWLAKTAVHEAFRLVRRDGRELSLELAAEQTPGLISSVVTPGADELCEQHERLDSIRRLPERQQRMLWMQGIGLSYADIAASTGCTTRTVERQLLRAKEAMRPAA
jgi:RNA polymerase sigma factor (sigma-70 family)